MRVSQEVRKVSPLVVMSWDGAYFSFQASYALQFGRTGYDADLQADLIYKTEDVFSYKNYNFHDSVANISFQYQLKPGESYQIYYMIYDSVDSTDMQHLYNVTAVRTGGTYAGIETDDVVFGSTTADHLGGAEGDDFIEGAGGDDEIDGGTGADAMYGGTGDDVYVVDSVGDRVRELAEEGNDLVYSAVSFVLPGNVEGLGLAGSANLTATGNGAQNLLVGNAGNNTLDGQTNADVMSGGYGNDVMIVDDVKDMVIEFKNQGTDLVKSSISYRLPDHVEKLALLGSRGLSATGNELNNVLTGNDGANTIAGGLGRDTLTGGRGSDTFVFKTVAEGGDRILDFSPGQKDRIDLGAIDASTALSGNQSFTFIGTKAFSKKAGELRYDKKASDTAIYGDVNGDGKADLTIHLDDAVTLSKGYFLL